MEANYTKDQLMEFLVHELEGKKTLAENQIAYLKVQDGEFFQRVKSRLDGYSELLIQLKAGGAGAEEIVAAWIRADGMSRINEINKDVKGLAKYRVKDLRSQRAKVIDDAIEKTRDELNNDFKNAFYQMLKLHLVASVRTGSKGDFSVPAETAYVYAELERDNGEHLIWMIQVNASSPEIRLSNSNTSKFWMLGLNME